MYMRNVNVLTLIVLLGVFILGMQALANDLEDNMNQQTAHDFSFESINGGDLKLSAYKGKPFLIVNTASECGFTKQYKGLQVLYDRYKDQGLVVLGVPSNNFGGQEPGSNEEIKEFCEKRFNVSFPLTEKADVSGKNAHPFYQWAGTQGKGGLLFKKPRWNFHKYLIGKDGELLESFGSMTDPLSDKMINAIEQALS